MAGNQFQKDLFEELGKPQRPLRRFQDLLPKKITVNISLEQLVFLGIGIMMALILLFAIGVEKGKRRAGFKVTADTAPARVKLPEPAETALRDRQQQAPITLAAEDDTPRTYAESTYTIQAATFRRRSSAEQESARLKKSGYDSYIGERGDFFQVCVGSFQKKEDADRTFRELRKKYKDCYIKKR